MSISENVSLFRKAEFFYIRGFQSLLMAVIMSKSVSTLLKKLIAYKIKVFYEPGQGYI